jgi:hypothetical protein
MKAESTIRKTMKRLREYIDSGDTTPKAQEEAYAMESALSWVLQKSSWNPVSLVNNTAKAERGET